MRRITLLTDFGTADGYVGAVKGVLAEAAPDALVDDVAHDIPPGDLHAAAWALARYWRLYPSGTVHLAVVDPGVGGARRALAARVDGRFLVAPDNGILTRALDQAQDGTAVEILNPAAMRDTVSDTFHARDVFAPAAAWLARGSELAALGPPVPDPVRLALPEPEPSGGAVHGEVIHVDRFGNLITNIPETWAAGAVRIRVAGHDVGPLRRTYGEVAAGAPVALIGSAELLEVSVRDGSAAAALGVGRGAGVVVERGAT